LFCLVTNRHRLLPPGADPSTSFEALLSQVRAAAAAGIDLIQIREPDLEAGELVGLTRRALEAVRDTATRVLVNERTDIALAAGAHGVHLRASSPPAARVRQFAPPSFLIGRSVHGAAEAIAVARAGGVDYLVLGTVFPTRSKPNGHPTIGLEEVARAARAITIPVLAIGGVTLERAADLAAAGASGVAAIGLFQPDSSRGEDPAKPMAEIVRLLRIAFDTTKRDPYHNA
jgi:thiamine-phosphate pyrophosphorylase